MFIDLAQIFEQINRLSVVPDEMIFPVIFHVTSILFGPYISQNDRPYTGAKDVRYRKKIMYVIS